MRNICALLALAGTAAIASAGYTMHWYWTGPATLNPGDTGHYTLYSKFASGPGEPLVGYAGSIFEITANASDVGGFISNGNGNDLLGDLSPEDGTQIDNNNIVGIDTFQLPPFFNPLYSYDNPIWVYELDITVNAPGTVTLTTQNHLNHSVYVSNMGANVESTPTIDAFRITVVPTPASLGLIGLGGLVAARRRR